MKHQSKLSPKQEHAEEQQTQAQANTAREFSNSDELLRYDAAQTVVPPEIAERLKCSSANLPPQKGGWFKRFFN